MTTQRKMNTLSSMQTNTLLAAFGQGSFLSGNCMSRAHFSPPTTELFSPSTFFASKGQLFLLFCLINSASDDIRVFYNPNAIICHPEQGV